MRIAAIDPGPKESAFVMLDDGMPTSHKKVENDELWRMIYEDWRFGQHPVRRTIIERIRAQGGKRVGNETFDACEWSGRFYESALGSCNPVWLPRIDAVRHVCKGRDYAGRADACVRQALIERFGKPGTAKNPGLTYGITKDCWQALAIAVTWWDKHGGK